MIIERCENTNTKTPKVEIQQRDIHIFLLIDTSMSIGESGIEAITHIISQLKTHLRKIETESLGCNIYIYDIVYSNYANWASTTVPTPVKIYSVPKLKAAGLSNIGTALSLMNSELIKIKYEDKKILLFINDGKITDDVSDKIDEIYSYKNCRGYSILVGHRDKIMSWDSVKLVQNINNVFFTTEINSLFKKFRGVLNSGF